MTVANARQTVVALQAKRDALETRKLMAEAERDSCAYDAYTGDAKAKAKLAEVNREIVGIDAELASLAAAIRTAEAKVIEAQGVEQAAAEKRKAERALELDTQASALAATLDETAHQLFEHFAAFRAVMVELHRLGAVPNTELVDSACRRALTAAASGSRLQIGHLPPNERHTFSELATRWSEGISAFTAQRLAEPEVEVVPAQREDYPELPASLDRRKKEAAA
jgi:hypothetical protein